MKLRLARVAAIAFMIVFGGTSVAQPPTPRFRLYVSLFSSIPDAVGDQFLLLKQRVKTEFEAKNPSLELLIKDLDPNDDAYTVKNDKPTRIGTWLTAPVIGDDPNKSGLHLVEADMVVLGELVKQGLIKPWESDPDTSDWHPAATAATTLDGKAMALPTGFAAISSFLIARMSQKRATPANSGPRSTGVRHQRILPDE